MFTSKLRIMNVWITVLWKELSSTRVRARHPRHPFQTINIPLNLMMLLTVVAVAPVNKLFSMDLMYVIIL